MASKESMCVYWQCKDYHKNSDNLALCDSSLNWCIAKDSRCRNRYYWDQKFKARSKCGRTGYILKKNVQHLVKSCLQRNCYLPRARNRVHIQKGDASKEEFGQTALAGGILLEPQSLSCLLICIDSFDKYNLEMGTVSGRECMARQTRCNNRRCSVQHYWVYMVKQQVTGCPTLRNIDVAFIIPWEIV